MSDTATWTNGITGGPGSDRAARVWAVKVVPTCLLAVGIFGLLSWQVRQRRALSRPEMEVGAGAGLALAAGLVLWKSSRERRWQAKNDRLQQRLLAVQTQLADARRAKDSLQRIQMSLEKRGEHLVEANAALRQELHKHDRAERFLSQRRLELESSRAVLELRVQERTQELEKLQRRYEMILNAAGDGICGLDAEGKTTFVNPAAAELTGWGPGELIGKTERELFGDTASTGLGQNSGEGMFYRKNGTRFPVEFVKTQITDDGRDSGAVLVFKDITARKRVEQTREQEGAELARSNAELEQFAIVAARDLREYLSKILPFGDRLEIKCEAALARDDREYLDQVQNAAGRMRTLVEDLLTFSRAIRRSEPFVPVNLSVVAKEVLGDLVQRIEKTGARLRVGELPTIDADPAQMRQLLLNLLGNALKFQPPGHMPIVEIDAEIRTGPAGEPICQLSVRDNGIGLDEKYLDTIFGVFQRLHGRGEYEGTGVGLAVCRRIVNRHRGSITARSEPGQGATFIVTLPLRQRPGRSEG